MNDAKDPHRWEEPTNRGVDHRWWTQQSIWLMTAVAAALSGTVVGVALLGEQSGPVHGTPPARYAAVLAPDRNGHVLLYGGRAMDDHRELSDTWTWDGIGWAQQTPATSPPGRSFAAAAYDPVRRETVIFGGGAGAELQRNDTWVWDGVQWTQRHPALSPQGSVRLMGYVPTVGRLMLLVAHDGKETWTWDGTNWTKVAASPYDVGPPTGLYQGVGVDGRGRFVVFGQTPHAPEGSRYQTWVYEAGGWRLLRPATTPGGGASRMAYDAARHQLVMLESDGTWTWDGRTWTRRRPSRQPPLPDDHDAGPPAMAFDAASGRVVFLGSGRTWTWDGADWTRSA